MRPIPPRLLVLLASLAFAAAGTAQAHPLWGGLQPGPHPVGFRTLWKLDYSRTYRTAFDDGATYGAEKAPRPVLINQWYPAAGESDAAAMPYRRYLDIRSEDAQLKKLALALIDYAQTVMAQGILGQPLEHVEGEKREFFDRLLATPTACRLGASPGAGPFPLVIYHAGTASSFEDNAILCEYLASHGFVVLGSAYQDAEGDSLRVDAGGGSVRDLEFLARFARTLPYVDWGRVAVVGHSAGGQAALRFAARPDSVANSVVLLDTTQDYYSLEMPTYRDLVDEIARGSTNVVAPILAVAGPEAMFALCDTLDRSDRLYLTVPLLEHDEFISQGILRLQIVDWLVELDPEGPKPKGANRIRPVRSRYEVLCRYVRTFLDASLNGDRSAFEAHTLEYHSTQLGDDHLHAEVVPTGVRDPDPYHDGEKTPPTPRQYRRIVASHSIEETCGILRKHMGDEPRSPIYSSSMLTGSLIYELAAQGKLEEARGLYLCMEGLQADILDLFRFLADLAAKRQRPEEALPLLKVANQLAPGDVDFAERLRALEPR